MHIDFLLDAFRADVVKDAVVWQDEPFSYAWLLVAVGRWTDFLRNRALAPGTVVSLEADFSPTSIALLLALVLRRLKTLALERQLHRAGVELAASVGFKGAGTAPAAGSDEARKVVGRLRQAGVTSVLYGATPCSRYS